MQSTPCSPSQKTALLDTLDSSHFQAYANFHQTKILFHNAKLMEVVMTETVRSEHERRQQFAVQDFVLNCSTLLTELPVNDRAAAAAEAGFTEVEFWWPFDGNPEPTAQQVDAFIASINNAGVSLVGLNFWAGNMASGDRGRVSTKGECSTFKANADIAAEIGRRTGCQA